MAYWRKVLRRGFCPALTKLVITASLLAFLLLRTPIREIQSRIGAVDVRTIVACLVILSALYVTYAIRWQLILKRFGADAEFAGVYRYTLVGAFFNQLLPSGMGGDVFRIWYARRFGVSTGKSIASVVVDRMFGFLAIALIVMIGFPIFLGGNAPRAFVVATIIAVAVLLLGIGCFLALDAFERPLLLMIHRIRHKAFQDWMIRLVTGLSWTAKATREMLAAWPAGPLAITVSVCNQLLIGCIVYWLLTTMGQSVTLGAVFVLFPLVLLLSMLPISFAGWGLREGAMIVAFGLVGVPSEVALSASILYGLILLGSSLPGGAVWLGLKLRVSAGSG